MKELLGRGGPRREKQCEVSFVVCCALTADSLKETLQKVRRTQESLRVRSEIIVVDNGVVSSAIALAEKANAVIATVDDQGYGASIMAAVGVSSGKYILAGVADGRYDFMELPKFFDKLHGGYDYVQGCRMPAGGGNIRPDAMSVSRRWVLNPLFSFLLKIWARTDLNDPGSRMFGISRKYYDSLGLSCVGTEFNTELVIKSSMGQGKVTEVPITLHQVGGGSSHPDSVSISHASSALTVYSAAAPSWLLFGPGILMILLGLVGVVAVSIGWKWGGERFNMHALILASGITLCGWQLVMFAFTFKAVAVRRGIVPICNNVDRLSEWIARSPGIIFGLLIFLAGLSMILFGFSQKQAFVGPDYGSSLKCFIPGVMLLIVGLQAILSHVVLKILGIKIGSKR